MCHSVAAGGPDIDETIKWYKKSGEQGFVKANYNLGVVYFKTCNDNANAIHYFELAAERGFPKAQVCYYTHDKLVGAQLVLIAAYTRRSSISVGCITTFRAIQQRRRFGTPKVLRVLCVYCIVPSWTLTVDWVWLFGHSRTTRSCGCTNLSCSPAEIR
jgi:hypothetical protein